MKPILLKMTAFGPYPSENIIDFRKLKNHNIFIITGPTGAGKTTIFDAICYALYGETSVNRKKGMQLRSDFAKEDAIKTQVEFIFCIRDKYYYIKRIPSQRRKKLRGEGFTEEPASVEFKELNDGVPITKDLQVKEEIEKAIGLTLEQFKNIVMIPQGDFRKFLDATTTEKEEILRKIFATHYYKNIQENLNKKTSLIKDNINDIEKKINFNKESIGLSDKYKGINISTANLINTLNSDIHEAENQNENLSKKLKNEEELLKLKNEEIHSAKIINQKFKQRDIENENLNKLNSLKDEFDEKEIKLKKGQNALLIFHYENNLIKKEKEKLDLQKDIVIQTENLNVLRKELESIKTKYQTIEDIQKSNDKEKLLVDSLKGYIFDVENIDKKQLELSNLESKLNRIVNNTKKYDNENNILMKDINKLDNLQSDFIKANKEEVNLATNKETLTELYNTLSNMYKYSKNYNIYILNLEEISKHKIILEKEKHQLEEEINLKRNLLINAQVIKLANSLKNDMPCPVCGSTHHPNPSKSDMKIPTDKEIKDLEDILKNKNKDLEQLNNDFLDIKSKINALKENIDKIFISLVDKNVLKKEDDAFDYDGLIKIKGRQISDSKKVVEEDIVKVSEKIKLLNEEIEKIKLKQKYQMDVQKKLEQLNNDKLDISIKYAGQKQSVDEILKKVPKEYMDIEILKKAIKSKEDDISNRQRYIKTIQTKYENINISMEKSITSINILSKNLEKSDLDYINCGDEFENELRKYFKDKDEYLSSKIDNNVLKSLDEEITKYKDDKNMICKSLQGLDKDLEGLDILDIEKLQNDIDNLIFNINVGREEFILTKKKIQDSKEILENIKKCYEKIKNEEEEYKILADLSKLANGESLNKVSFETFVLCSYFEDVLLSANKRLKKMSNSRYFFIRREESKGNGRKGLELDIYDNYTCKSRAVNTLSGGESFEASLSLALGLSDTMQNTYGGIKLDTMFIDEGFGTLDTESLDMAIDILMELQDNGRLIGVISHVSELRERIPARIIVKSDVNGSKIDF